MLHRDNLSRILVQTAFAGAAAYSIFSLWSAAAGASASAAKRRRAPPPALAPEAVAALLAATRAAVAPTCAAVHDALTLFCEGAAAGDARAAAAVEDAGRARVQAALARAEAEALAAAGVAPAAAEAAAAYYELALEAAEALDEAEATALRFRGEKALRDAQRSAEHFGVSGAPEARAGAVAKLAAVRAAVTALRGDVGRFIVTKASLVSAMRRSHDAGAARVRAILLRAWNAGLLKDPNDVERFLNTRAHNLQISAATERFLVEETGMAMEELQELAKSPRFAEVRPGGSERPRRRRLAFPSSPRILPPPPKQTRAGRGI